MSSISLRGHKVTLTMDTQYNYPESTFFRVCPYNSSCCFCDSKEKCEWGELSGHTDSVRKYVSCQFTTSQPGLYQFQIKTGNYPCFFNIGDPIDVNNSSSSAHDHILIYSVGGGVGMLLFLVAGIVLTYCIWKRYKRGQVRRRGKEVFNY